MLTWACSGGEQSATTSETKKGTKKETPAANDGKGVGEVKSVELNDPLDTEMIARGQGIYDMKCSACHKASGQRVVGPGFLGVTDRRKPEWIMNMVTNVEEMLEEDEEARKLLEQCLVRMPNQNLTQSDSRDVLEWMFNNDAKADSK
jgi:cytochrome c